MQPRRFGTDVPNISEKEIKVGEEDVPGMGWNVSDEARREIDDIEDNIRASGQMSGMLLMG